MIIPGLIKEIYLIDNHMYRYFLINLVIATISRVWIAFTVMYSALLKP